MNKFKLVLASFAAALLPLWSFAQQPVPTKLTEFNYHNVETIEERVFILHSIQESNVFTYRLSLEEGKIDIFVTDDYNCQESNANSDFDAFMEDLEVLWMAHCNLDKNERGRSFVEWRYQLDDPVFLAINEDFHRQLRDNNTCDGADPFCTDNGLYQFPAGVNAGNLGSSTPPYYCSGFTRPNGSSSSCLYTTPNPAFYYMQIDQPGNLNIYMYSTPSVDIDFDCWGPFSDINTACSQLSCSNMVDCSYSANATENCYINNAQTGQYYILLITNYSNQTCNISFSNIGTGTTNCGILPPLVDNDGPYCVGQTIHLTANGQSGASYSWTGPGGFTSTQQNPTRPNCTMAMAGTYTCTISVGSATNNATTEVVVYPQPTANFDFSTVCQGQPTQFTNTSTTNPAGQTITSYLWNFGSGQTSTQQNPTYTFPQAGTHPVTLTVSCGGGLCTSTVTKQVTVYASPVANAGPDQTISYGSSAQLSGSGGAGSFSFHWEPANMVVNPNAQNTQTVTLTQDQTYTLTVSNTQGGCVSTDQVTIHINGSAMTATAYANPPSICLGSSTQLQVNAGGGTGHFTYSWSPTTWLSNPNIANPIATPPSTTTYTCHVTDGETSLNVPVTVTVNMPEYSEETHYICPGEIFEWNGQSYSDEDDYDFVTTTQQGCERIITLHLRHYPTYDETLIEEAICAGESYIFYGVPYFNSIQTSYTDHTIHGCDSIIRLDLTVYEDNGITEHPVSVCPNQLPYYYEYDLYHQPLYEGTHDFTLQDRHGCDSVVRVILDVNDYYIPPVQTEYVCYQDTPSFTWDVNGQTYDHDIFVQDTLPTQDCDGIFRLDLYFQQTPEIEHTTVVACDRYTWPVNGRTYTESTEDEHRVSLAPFPCDQVYQLHLTINNQSLLDDVIVSDECDEYAVSWFGQDTVFYENTVHTFTGLTDEGCYREQTYRIQNMKYTPRPRIRCSDQNVEFPHQPITATEFNVNRYTYYAFDTLTDYSWINSECEWAISKESWRIEPSDNNRTCTVYAMDWVEDTIWLTFKAVNPCSGDDGIIARYWLKPSFYGIEERDAYPASVGIMPNPNNGQMTLCFDNMDGDLDIKVYAISGALVDSFALKGIAVGDTYNYAMKRLGDGVYFFTISDGKRSVTKKVVIIH